MPISHTGTGRRSGWPQQALACMLMLFVSAASADDFTPYNPANLPPLGQEWAAANPYRGNAEIALAGGTAFNHNCARCHGVNAVATGANAMPAPDLRKLDRFCRRIADSELRNACMSDIDDYFRAAVLYGKVVVGVQHMPAWKGLLTQETIWAMKTFIESRANAKR